MAARPRLLYWLVLCLLVTLAFPAISQSQTYQAAPEWQRTYWSNSESDTFRRIIVTGEGDVYVTGKRSYYASGPTYDKSTTLYFVAKYDSNGVKLWDSFEYEEPGSTCTVGYMVVDSAGQVYVSGTKELGVFGEPYWFTRKYSSGGLLLWERTIEDPNPADGNDGGGPSSLVLSPDEQAVYCYGMAEFSPGTHEYWLTKYSASGATLWQDVYDVGNIDYWGVAYLDDLGNVVTSGLDGWASPDSMKFVRKYSPSGTVLWTRSHPQNRSSSPWGASWYYFSPGANGDVFVPYQSSTEGNRCRMYDHGGSLIAEWILTDPVGWNMDHNGQVYFRTGSGGSELLTKYDRVGTELWSVPLTSDDGTDNLYISDALYVCEHFADHMRIVKYSQAGQFQWDLDFTFPFSDMTNTWLLLDPADRVYIRGEHTGTCGTEYVDMRFNEYGNCLWYGLHYNPLICDDMEGTSVFGWDDDYNAYYWGSFQYKDALDGYNRPIVGKYAETPPEEENQTIRLEATLGPDRENVIYLAEPVNPSNGNYVWSKELFSYPGPGFNFNFGVYYNSLVCDESEELGFGWTHSYNISLDWNDTEQEAAIVWGDGHKDFFLLDEGEYSPVGCYAEATLEDIPGGGWLCTQPSGKEFTFDDTEKLTQIVDRNGNTATFTYTGDKLTQITDTSGRAITFTYDGVYLTGVSGPLFTVGFAYDVDHNLTEITDCRSNTREFTYDTSHRLLTYTDNRGNTVVTNTYDTEGRVETQSDYFTHETTFVYATVDGNTEVTITPPSGNATVHTYDENYNLIQVLDPCGNDAIFAYDGGGRREAAMDKGLSTTSASYDGQGNPVGYGSSTGANISATFDGNNQPLTINDGTGNSVTMTYDANGNRESMTDQLGETTTYVYNTAGLVTGVISPGGSTWGITYNAQGLPRTRTMPSSAAFTTTYDAAGRPTRIDMPYGLYKTFAYDGNSNLISSVDTLGQETTFSYDENGNLISRTFVPLSATTSFTYNEMNRLTQQTGAEGGVFSYTYDENGNLETMTDPDGVTTTYTYDACNNVATVSNELAESTSYAFSATGHLASRTDAAGYTWGYEHDSNGRIKEINPPGNGYIAFDYDILGRQTWQRDQEYHETSMEYDAVGRVIKKTLPGGRITRFAYDANGNISRVTDPLGRHWDYGYDTSKRVTSMTDPLGQSETYGYNSLGWMTSLTDRKGQAFTFDFDDGGRVDTIHLPGSEDVDFTYDAVGNPLSVTRGALTTSKTFDKLGRMLSFTNPYGQSMSFTYTDAGLPDTITYPGSRMVDYDYDAAGRLVSITDWLANVTSFSYDAAGRVTQTDYPNGCVCEREYNSYGWVSNLLNKTSGEATITQYAPSYHDNGQISHMGTVEAADPVFEDYRTTNTYNAADRQTAGAASSETASYVHDAAGCRTSRTLGVDTITYSYDPLNRLVSVQGGGLDVEYTYDGHGTLVQRDENGTRTRYLRDGRKLWCAYDPDSSAMRFYIWAAGILYSLDESGDMRVYHPNLQGSVSAVTDATETVVLGRVYDPYGKVLGESGTLDEPLGFLGVHGVITDSTGLVQTGERFYDPLARRFLTEDPLGPLGGMNLYAYTTGDPISSIDPSGFSEEYTQWSTRGIGDDEYTEKAKYNAYPQYEVTEDDILVELNAMNIGKGVHYVFKGLNFISEGSVPAISSVESKLNLIMSTSELVDKTTSPEYKTTGDHIHNGAMWFTKVILSKVSPGAAMTLCVIDYLVTNYGREYMVKVLTEVYGRDAARDLEMIYIMKKTRGEMEKIKREVQDEMDEFYAQLDERDKQWRENREQVHLEIMSQGAGIDDGLNGCSVK